MNDPRDENELIKMREQHRDFLSEKFLLANKIYAEQTHAHRMNAIANVKEYGTLTIRSLFILHGGAMIALLGFIGSLFAKGGGEINLNSVHYGEQPETRFLLLFIRSYSHRRGVRDSVCELACGL